MLLPVCTCLGQNTQLRYRCAFVSGDEIRRQVAVTVTVTEELHARRRGGRDARGHHGHAAASGLGRFTRLRHVARLGHGRLAAVEECVPVMAPSGYNVRDFVQADDQPESCILNKSRH